jgi:hypothetical protein
MSLRRRRIIGILLVVVFVCTVPAIVLYANGYRLGHGEVRSLVITGGVFIASPSPNASLSIDGVHVADTGYFTQYFYIDNISPGLHTVDVVATTSRPWHKEIVVYPNKVVRMTAFLPPEQVHLIEIAVSNTSQVGTEASDTVSSTQLYTYKDIAASFASSSPQAISSTTATVTSGVALWKEGQSLIAEWRGDLGQIPDQFCSLHAQDQVCQKSVEVQMGSNIHSFAFLPGRNDVVIAATQKGVFFSEIDARSRRTTAPIYVGKDADFRIVDHHVFLKLKNKLYQVDM